MFKKNFKRRVEWVIQTVYSDVEISSFGDMILSDDQETDGVPNFYCQNPVKFSEEVASQIRRVAQAELELNREKRLLSTLNSVLLSVDSLEDKMIVGDLLFECDEDRAWFSLVKKYE